MSGLVYGELLQGKSYRARSVHLSRPSLDAFLDIAGHIRIKSDTAQEAGFQIDVTAGQARGRVRAIYDKLEVAVLDQQTGTENGAANRVASFLANVLKVRNANVPEGSGSMKVTTREDPTTSFWHLRGSPCEAVSWISSAIEGGRRRCWLLGLDDG